jgi:hypothetical protein
MRVDGAFAVEPAVRIACDVRSECPASRERTGPVKKVTISVTLTTVIERAPDETDRVEGSDKARDRLKMVRKACLEPEVAPDANRWRTSRRR